MGNPLVIKDDDRLAGKLFGKNIRIGWRVPCTDGTMDVMWGSTKDEASLQSIIEDVRRQYDDREIIDERVKDAKVT